MLRLILLAALAAVGCGGGGTPTSETPKPGDPNVRVKESRGGSIGPVGAGQSREYEGPASKAPEWTKVAPPKSK